MKRSIFLFFLVSFFLNFIGFGENKNYPKEYISNKPIQEVWDKAHDALKKLKYEIKSENKAKGIIVTKNVKLLNGLEAANQLKKIAVLPTNYTTLFEGGYYYLEVKIKFLGPQKTLVIPYCYIKGEKVTIEGKKKLVTLESNWNVEFRFLNQLAILLTGKPLPKKYRNFWDRNLEEINIH